MKIKKYWAVAAIFLFLLFLVLFRIFQVKSVSPRTPTVPQNTESINSGSTVAIGDISIKVEVADTIPLQIKGLSGHAPLAENEGMLFIFSDSRIRGFWMKDMLFPIDIIWIDETGTIVGIEKSAEMPQFGTPESKLPVYTSDKPVKYVLEVNSGFSEKYSLEVGDMVQMNLR